MNRADWIALAVAAALVSMVLYPVFAKRKGGRENYACTPHLRLIAIGLLSYARDYDERLPVAVSSIRVGGRVARRNWAVGVTLPGGGVSPGLLSPYVEQNSTFHDPHAGSSGAPLTYMYNDLAAASPLAGFAKPVQTVLVVDGEELLDNVGHAWVSKRRERSNGAKYNAQGRCDAGRGAFVTEDATTRHSGGANYAFADGHIKWFKPGNIYFPLRASASPHHRDAASGAVLGPEPGGTMTWNKRTWAGTFHLR